MAPKSGGHYARTAITSTTNTMSQLGVYAKSKECQPGVDPYSRLKYQLFLETKDGL